MCTLGLTPMIDETGLRACVLSREAVQNYIQGYSQPTAGCVACMGRVSCRVALSVRKTSCLNTSVFEPLHSGTGKKKTSGAHGPCKHANLQGRFSRNNSES